MILMSLFLFAIPPAIAQQNLSPAATQALDRAGDNKAQLLSVLQNLPENQHKAFDYLIADMPDHDLKSLSAEFINQNITLAHDAMKQVPWAAQIPSEIFLDNILPYANLNEKRDNWRPRFYKDFLPLVIDCTTISQAAEKLNATIFKQLNVKYSRKRNRVDQGPFETIETGMATCTGLSILLVDACRAVGIPARVAGIPRWSDMSGNHTWVEIWDDGWHYTGAAEPAKLDHAWFTGKAATAQPGHRSHAIYATSWKKTDKYFPLIWARDIRYVNAVDNTAMYLPKEKIAPSVPQLSIKVMDKKNGTHIEANVKLFDLQNNLLSEGTSKGPQADMNFHLDLPAPSDEQFIIEILHAQRKIKRQLITADCTSVLEFFMNETVSSVESDFAKTAHAKELKTTLQAWFDASPEERKEMQFSNMQNNLLKSHNEDIRNMAWQAYRHSRFAESFRNDFDNNLVKNNTYTSPYFFKKIGQKPDGGWPLFIAMHGGGGAPTRVNDSQWDHMKVYYHDQMQAGGYIYLALRAPTDEWNGFYTSYIYPLIGNLIRQFMIFEDTNPDKVYVMGYSHGGYGTFAIGPNMADRFAAAHASASAPTNGETSARNLRNLTFTYMIGEKDTAYNRAKFCKAFDEKISLIRADRQDIYPVTMELKEGFGHGGLPDKDKIAEMIKHTRNPIPQEISWELTVNNIPSFYWLHLPTPEKGQKIEAACKDNVITLDTENVNEIHILLDNRLVDMNKDVTVRSNGKDIKIDPKPSLETICQTLMDRGDPKYMFATRIVVTQTSRQPGGKIGK